MNAGSVNSTLARRRTLATFMLRGQASELHRIAGQLKSISTDVEKKLDRERKRHSRASFSASVANILQTSLNPLRVRKCLVEEAEAVGDPSWAILMRLMLARIDQQELTAEELDVADERGQVELGRLIERRLVVPVRGTTAKFPAYRISNSAYNVFVATGLVERLGRFDRSQSVLEFD